MINRYFACCDCKIYIDAGGRWAYWTLEDAGVVQNGAPISVKAVLSTKEYWNPEKKDGHIDWLYNEIFPSVRLFLKEHESHRIIFGDKDNFLFGDDENYWEGYFDWMQVGFLAAPSPRAFVEQRSLRTWDEVCDYTAKQDREIWWMHDEEMRKAARRKFKELIESKDAT
jgi:hypothetical protein